MKYLPFTAAKEGLLSNQISDLRNEKLAFLEISLVKYTHLMLLLATKCGCSKRQMQTKRF